MASYPLFSPSPLFTYFLATATALPVGCIEELRPFTRLLYHIIFVVNSAFSSSIPVGAAQDTFELR